MKLFHKAKDGGNESNVTGYWLIESKRFFSIVLLCFNKGSREAFHSHAFNALSWIIKGELEEHVKQGGVYSIVKILPSFIPIFTSRERMHKVYGVADKTWALSFRGPWTNTWKEYLPKEQKEITLTNGRVIINGS